MPINRRAERGTVICTAAQRMTACEMTPWQKRHHAICLTMCSVHYPVCIGRPDEEATASRVAQDHLVLLNKFAGPVQDALASFASAAISVGLLISASAHAANDSVWWLVSHFQLRLAVLQL